MKIAIFLILIFIPLFLFSATWETTESLSPSVSETDRIDLFSNKDGNHVIIQTSTQLKYYLFDYEGTQVRTYTIDSNISESPRLSQIAGYLDTLYVVYKEGSYIYTKRSVNEGQSWSSMQNISLSSSTSNGMDLWMDENNLHIAWSELSVSDYETYYKKYSRNDNLWSSKETVTNSTNDYGGFPSITSSPSRAHVGYNQGSSQSPIGNYADSKTRDKYNSTWQTPQTVQSQSARDHVIADDSDLHCFYYTMVEEEDDFLHPLYVRNRSLSGSTWSSATTLISNCDPENQPLDATIDANEQVHIAYTGCQYRNWDGEDWSTAYNYSSAGYFSTFFQQINANGNDIFVVWIEEERDEYSLKLRQRDEDPLTPFSLAWSDTVNDHPKISWDFTNCDIDSFWVFRAMGNTSPLTWTKIDSTPNAYYVDTGITIGSGYGPNYANYKVLAKDHFDNESDTSSVLQIQYMVDFGSGKKA